MDIFSFIDEELNFISNEGLKREFKTVMSAPGPWVELEGNKRVLQFASNNYLGLCNHPEIINATKAAVSKYGVGSTGSRLLSGTTELHTKLESVLSDFEGTEATILFSSGYSANLGVLSALLTPEDAAYSDELNHASIIDGVRLSKATKFIYKHNDMEHLESLVKENYNKYKKNLIVTDTVFSMDGDIALLENIAQVAGKYNCLTLLDEAHATGVFGKNGSGVTEHLKLENLFPIKIGTCSKALAIEGGFCSAPYKVIEYIKHKARSFMFSTSLSPPVLAGILKSLELLKDGLWRREKLWQNAWNLYNGLKKIYKLNINEFLSPIICVYFNTNQEAIDFSNRLFHECHIWAPAIRPPTVKKPRIRLTPISTHSEEDINYTIKAFEHLAKDLKVDLQKEYVAP